MATRYQTSWARPAALTDCSTGAHKPSRAALRQDGAATVTRCTHCGCRLIKNAVTRSWYVSGLMG